MKQYFEGNNKKKTWVIIGVVVAIILVFAGTRAYKNGGSIATPKSVSFVQQTKGSGTHVWVQTWSESGEITKDDIVSKIFVMKNGKTQTFQIFDGNVTLGKLSSMSDADTIKLAENQDKKYSTTGAIQEIKNYQKDKKSVGQESDLNDEAKAVADGEIPIFYVRYDNSINIAKSDPNVPRLEKIKNVYPSFDDAQDHEDTQEYQTASHFTLNDLAQRPTKNSGFKTTDSKFGKAIIKHIEDSQYQSPNPNKISVKNYTDNSGNKIVNQKIMYTSIDLFNTTYATDNVYKIAKENKVDILKLISYRLHNDYGLRLDKIGNQEYDDFTKYRSNVKQMDSEGYAIYQKLFSNYSEITKGVYGFHDWHNDFTIGDPTSQKIYKSRYIGYTITSDGGGHILTKAQNDKQKAVLAK